MKRLFLLFCIFLLVPFVFGEDFSFDLNVSVPEGETLNILDERFLVSKFDENILGFNKGSVNSSVWILTDLVVIELNDTELTCSWVKRRVINTEKIYWFDMNAQNNAIDKKRYYNPCLSYYVMESYQSKDGLEYRSKQFLANETYMNELLKDRGRNKL